MQRRGLGADHRCDVIARQRTVDQGIRDPEGGGDVEELRVQVPVHRVQDDVSRIRAGLTSGHARTLRIGCRRGSDR